MRKLHFLVGLTFIFLVLSYSGAAISGAGVSTGSGNQTANTGSGSSQSVTTQAGAVSEVNVSSDSLTQKWAGFYGNVSGQKVLGDGSGNNFYTWTASSFGNAKVITVPSGDSMPTNITAVSSPNTYLGGEYQGGADEASNTFTSSASVTLDGDSANTVYVDTYTSDNDDDFRTYLAKNDDAGQNPVYIAAGQSANPGFNTQSINYQMLVGVGESPSSKTYDFYLELP